MSKTTVENMAALNRFFVFAGALYYPNGGWGDFCGSFDSLEGAVAALVKEKYDWCHVVDSETGQIVFDPHD